MSPIMSRIIRNAPMRFVMSWLLAITLLAVTSLAVPPAAAQLGTNFRNAPKLTSTDVAMIRKLVREQLTGKPNGTTLNWNNPASGNSGSVTLLAAFASSGRDCRRVRYVVHPAASSQISAADTNTYVLTNCRLANGSWKLDGSAKPDAR
jgi:surface antigen